MSKPGMQYKYDLCENEIQCNGRTIAYADHSIFDIEDKQEFNRTVMEMGLKLGWMVQRANAAPEMLEVCQSVAGVLQTWKNDFASDDEHKRTVINTLIHDLLEAARKASGKDAE